MTMQPEFTPRRGSVSSHYEAPHHVGPKQSLRKWMRFWFPRLALATVVAAVVAVGAGFAWILHEYREFIREF
jgi:hypothetical protein